MKMKPLAEPAERVVRENLIEVVPENQRTILLHWLENIRDGPCRASSGGAQNSHLALRRL